MFGLPSSAAEASMEASRLEDLFRHELEAQQQRRFAALTRHAQLLNLCVEENVCRRAWVTVETRACRALWLHRRAFCELQESTERTAVQRHYDHEVMILSDQQQVQLHHIKDSLYTQYLLEVCAIATIEERYRALLCVTEEEDIAFLLGIAAQHDIVLRMQSIFSSEDETRGQIQRAEERAFADIMQRAGLEQLRTAFGVHFCAAHCAMLAHFKDSCIMFVLDTEQRKRVVLETCALETLESLRQRWRLARNLAEVDFLSAITISKAWRGYKGRSVAARRRASVRAAEAAATRDLSATVLQKHCRTMTCYKTTAAIIRQRVSIFFEETIDRRVILNAYAEECRVISSNELLMYSHRNRAATTINSCARGFLVRRHFKRVEMFHRQRVDALFCDECAARAFLESEFSESWARLQALLQLELNEIVSRHRILFQDKERDLGMILNVVYQAEESIGRSLTERSAMAWYRELQQRNLSEFRNLLLSVLSTDDGSFMYHPNALDALKCAESPGHAVALYRHFLRERAMRSAVLLMEMDGRGALMENEAVDAYGIWDQMRSSAHLVTTQSILAEEQLAREALNWSEVTSTLNLERHFKYTVVNTWRREQRVMPRAATAIQKIWRGYAARKATQLEMDILRHEKRIRKVHERAPYTRVNLEGSSSFLARGSMWHSPLYKASAEKGQVPVSVVALPDLIPRPPSPLQESVSPAAKIEAAPLRLPPAYFVHYAPPAPGLPFQATPKTSTQLMNSPQQRPVPVGWESSRQSTHYGRRLAATVDSMFSS